MPRPCSICSHSAHHEIDRALVEGRSPRTIAAEFGLNHQAVERHRAHHLPITIRRAAREALAREEAAASAATPSNDAPFPPIANALPAPSQSVGEALAVSPNAPPASRTRRRGMMLDPAALVAPNETVAREPLATSVGADRTAPGPAGPLDLHAAITALQNRALQILETAEADRDLKTALTAIREARGAIDSLARLVERTGGNAQTVPLVQSPEWTRTRTAIVAALEPFPDARLAVAEALVATGSVS